VTAEYEKLRDENLRLLERLSSALDTPIGVDLTTAQNPHDAFVARARYIVCLSDAIKALKDATYRGTASMHPEKLKARASIMAVAEAVLQTRLDDELELCFKYVRRIDELRSDAPIDKTMPSP
jgi:hypothetical protein